MKHLRFLVYSSLLIMAGCSSDNPDTPDVPNDDHTKVNLTTRAENPTDGSTLQAGLYMVNYFDGQPDELLATNNYVNNLPLIWQNNVWAVTTPFYWNDMSTPADFYAYSPYQSTVDDARLMPFSVQTDQRSDESFALSDLYWGTVQGQSPTAEGFNLTLQHILSRLTVNVTADAGFAEDELKASDVSVTIGGTRTSAVVDLQTGAVNVLEGASTDVACHNNGDFSFTAILLPQRVPFSNLIQVEWLGNRYTLQNAFLLEAKRQYNLTVKLKKTQSGFDIGIDGWDILPEDFGGIIGG